MKRLIFRVTFLASLIMVFGAGNSYAAEKYAFVNVAQVFDKYQKTIDNDRTLQEAGKEKEGERDGIVKDIRQLKDELILLTDDAKAKKQESLDEKIRMLQNFDRQAKRELGETRRQVIQTIFQDIDQVVQDYGKRKGYDMIFNERALLFHNEKYDITEDIVNELNKGYKK